MDSVGLRCAVRRRHSDKRLIAQRLAADGIRCLRDKDSLVLVALDEIHLGQFAVQLRSAGSRERIGIFVLLRLEVRQLVLIHDKHPEGVDRRFADDISHEIGVAPSVLSHHGDGADKLAAVRTKADRIHRHRLPLVHGLPTEVRERLGAYCQRVGIAEFVGLEARQGLAIREDSCQIIRRRTRELEDEVIGHLNLLVLRLHIDLHLVVGLIPVSGDGLHRFACQPADIRVLVHAFRQLHHIDIFVRLECRQFFSVEVNHLQLRIARIIGVEVEAVGCLGDSVRRGHMDEDGVRHLLDVHLLTLHFQLCAHLRQHAHTGRDDDIIDGSGGLELQRRVGVQRALKVGEVLAVKGDVRQLAVTGRVLHINLHKIIRLGAVLRLHMEVILVFALLTNLRLRGCYRLEAVVRGIIEGEDIGVERNGIEVTSRLEVLDSRTVEDDSRQLGAVARLGQNRDLIGGGIGACLPVNGQFGSLAVERSCRHRHRLTFVSGDISD